MIAGFRNNPTGDVAFGQALSIGEDLGGAANAILFICIRVTYGQPCYGSTGYLTRYWLNRQRWIDYRAGLTELLEGMSKDSSLFWSPPLRRDDPLRPCRKTPPPGRGKRRCSWRLGYSCCRKLMICCVSRRWPASLGWRPSGTYRC